MAKSNKKEELKDTYLVEVRYYNEYNDDEDGYDEPDYTTEYRTFYSKEDAFVFAKKTQGNVIDILYYPKGTDSNPQRLLFAKGGKTKETKKETYYIDFLNKKKNFSVDRVTFDDYEKARKWAMKNFESFDPDMIKIKYSNGGTMNTTENLKRRLKFIAEDVDRLFDTLPQEVLEMPVEGYENVKTLLMNIEIATDLSSDESDSWKFGNKMANGGSILNSNYSIGGL